MPNDEDSVSPGEALPPPSAPPSAEERADSGSEPGGSSGSSSAWVRSRTNSANRPAPGRMVGTPGAAGRRKLAAEREMLRYRLKRQPQLEAERQGRRRGDAVESDPGASARHGMPVSGTVRKKGSPWLVAAGVAG